MSDPTIVVNGTPYPVPTSFTLGEEAEMERITGQGYDLTKPGPLGLLAIAFIAIKRVDPTVSVDDLKLLSPDAFQVEKGDEPTPTPLPVGGSSGSSDRSSDGGTPDLPAAA